MKALLFVAGLGDFIRVCYETDSYVALSTVTEMTSVVLALHNPYGAECFIHHPRRQFLRIIDLPGQFDHLRSLGLQGQELQDALMRAAGQDPMPIVFNRIQAEPIFYAIDDIPASRHVVLQPFAGGAARNIPIPILVKIVEACAATRCQIHLITRGFMRHGGVTHGNEVMPRAIINHPAVVWHENLSVPATINLIKNCSLFVGSHSSMLMAAWFEKRPVHVLYPRNQADWTPEKIGKGYSFGAFYDTTVHQCFEEFSLARLEKQLGSISGPPDLSGTLWQSRTLLRPRPHLRL